MELLEYILCCLATAVPMALLTMLVVASPVYLLFMLSEYAREKK